MQKPIRRIPVLLALLLSLLVAGCSPQAKKAGYLKTGDDYLAAGDYEKAEIEYLNALKIEALNPHAIGRLGLIYFDEGRVGQAIAYLTKGRELDGNDLDVRVKYGQVSLLIGNTRVAKDEALFILAHRPADAEAPMLLVSTITKPDEVEEARQRLSVLPAPAPAGAPVLSALAMIDLRTGHYREAEEGFNKALAVDPKFAPAYSALAMLQMAKKNSALAEKYFKAAADASPWHSTRRLQYAQFKVRSGDFAGGKVILDEIIKQAPDSVAALSARADLAYSEHKFDESLEYVTKVLSREPSSFEGLLLHGRLKLAKGDYAAAVDEFTKMATSFPKVAVVQYELGRALSSTGETTKAFDALGLAIKLAPGYPEPIMLLASLNIRKGDSATGIVLVRKLVEQRPELLEARLLLADAYRAQSNFDEALAIYQGIEKQLPDNPQPPLLRGLVLTQLNRPGEARQAFERSFTLAPDNIAALEQLVNLDLLDKKFAAARERITAESARHPKLANYGQLLIAKTYLAESDLPQAEVALKKAIAAMPDSPTPYFLLAGLYSDTKQLPKALANLEQVRAHNPEDTAALMMIGVIHDQDGNYAAARDAYEKLLIVNPQSFAALNNLAYLLSEHFNELEKAHQLAQKARELQPQEAHTADTLGWILYKKHQYSWALGLLQDAALQLPAEPEVQYHLGMTHYMMGEENFARLALRQATRPGINYVGIDEARKSLAVLDLDLNKVGPESQKLLEARVAERADDPMAQTRLAAIYERSGNRDKAIALLESTLKISPGNITALVSLARLEAANKSNARALELAKAARNLAPSDPAIALALGRLAYQMGDYVWADSLLREAARNQATSPDLLYDLALANYSVGRVDDAETAMNGALKAGDTFLNAPQAKQFLDLTALAANPVEAAKQSERVDKDLAANPASVPALMASAAASEQRGDPAAASSKYEKVLGIFSNFTPAKGRLAILGAAKSEFDQKAYDWALEARVVDSSNPQLAKALGILSYRKGDFPRAISLLKESSASLGSDADVFYFLGLAQSRLKDAAAKQNLQHAIELGLRADYAAEAQKAVAASK